MSTPRDTIALLLAGPVVGCAVGRCLGLATHPRTRCPARWVDLGWSLFVAGVWEYLLWKT